MLSQDHPCDIAMELLGPHDTRVVLILNEQRRPRVPMTPTEPSMLVEWIRSFAIGDRQTLCGDCGWKLEVSRDKRGFTLSLVGEDSVMLTARQAKEFADELEAAGDQAQEHVQEVTAMAG
jgi:hypothetical protein